MKIRHDKMKKDDRPVQGETYNVYNGETPLFQAVIKEYSGACWAKISVQKPLSTSVENVYKSGDEFDIKVASYRYEKQS